MSWQPGLPPPQTSQSVPLAPFNQQQNQSQQWQQVNQQPVNPPSGHLWQGNSGNPGWQADLQRQQVSGGLVAKAPHQQNTTSNSGGAPYQPQSMTSKHFQTVDAFDNPGDGWGDWDWNDNQQQPHGQQNYQPFQHQQQFQQTQQPSVQSPNNNRFIQSVPEVNAFPQAPPQVPQVPQNMFSQPPVSFTPSPQQNPPQNPQSNFPNPPAFVHQVNQNVIEDSFSTDHGSWNWSLDASTGQKTSPKTSQSNHSRNASMGGGGELVENQQQLPENILASLPDEARNTQGNLPNPLLSRVMKSDHQLTPQWSTESQMSHSSSDRSGESENLDSRSSMTTSEEPHNDSSRSFSPKKVEYNHQILDKQPDKLDETLMALSVATAPPKVDSPKSPPLERQTQSPGILPTPPQTNLARASPGPPPPVASAQRSNDRNPFKRSGMAVHKTLQFQAASKPTVSPDNFYQPPLPVSQETINQETLVPDNAEVVPQVTNQFPPIRSGPEVENHEIAPNNDRNQFLETGHLAEENLSVPAPATNSPPSEAVDSLPPPGLSRYVLGEPEVRPSGGMDVPEPPPGLDRMVPGTDLANASNLSMERQADGQVSNLLSTTTNRRMVQQVPDNTSSLQERNLYLASSETEIQPQSQRVVTGDESGRHTFTPIVQSRDHEMVINDQRRDLEVDGENLQDQQPQRIDRLRDEPIEGANTGDDDQTGNVVGNNATEAESVATNDTGRKDASNVSTCDDSDKDRNYYKSGSRRDDRRKPKERYDSEDSEYGSDHGRRRYREGSNRDDRYERDRDKYGRYEGRYSSREEYNRRRDDRDDIDSRRDEKGRRYRREYDRDRRDDRRKDDRYRDRDEKDRDRRRGRRYDYDDDYSRRDRDMERERGVRDDRRKDDRYRDREEKDRDRRRGDRRYDYEDPYHRSGSRNTDRDRMREKDPRYNQGYYQQGYGYDYSYYSQQQMQYYEALRRTNPQAYAEWYRKYYAQMQPQIAVSDIPTDGRESVHSGRSSANDKERRSMQQFYQPHDYQRSFSQSNNSTIMDGSYVGGNSGSFHQQQPSSLPYQQPQSFYVPNSGRQFYSQSDYSESRFENTYNLEKTSESAEVARLTPKKFTNEHTSASLSAAGLLVCIKPRYTATGVSNLVKILNLGANDATRKLFHAYPGPLVRGTTHKKTVIEFCEDQIRLGPPSDAVLRSRGNSMSSLCSQQSANRASFTLLWNLLILLLRQNGMVVGTDISELLMKNKSEFPYEFDQSQPTAKISSDRNSVQSDSKKSRDNSDGDVDESADEDERQASEEKQTLSPEEVTNKFRNYLLYGNVNEALDWATENNLWGHALFLASKVDRRSHANVMMKFANKLPLSDPLQTLYQLMSLRTPSSVTSAVDEKWGDWRPHLAMIISNTSQKPELNIKAITTLGDSLYNRGDVFGAHFCYLMAQVNFGKYRNVNQDSSIMANSSTSPRLILLGSSPHRTFRQFATNEAIMMTEIYEYACTLNDEKFSVTEFQPYKYILASRMIDYGMQLKALLYMEQISRHIQKDPSKYEEEFIERVFVMADRLKYYDPMHEKSLDDTSPDAQEGGVDGQNWLSDLQSVLRQFNSGVLSYHSSSVQNLTHDPQVSKINTGYAPAQTVDYSKSEIDEQFREINQQFNQLNLQYQAEQQQQQNQPISLDYSAPAMNPPVPDYQSQQLGDPYQNQYPSMPYGGGGGGIDQGNPVASMDSPNYYDPSQFGSVAQHNVDNTSNYDYYGQSQSNTEPLPPSSQTPSSVEGKSGEEVPEIAELQESPKRLQRQPVEDMPKPQITMPNSFSNKPGFYEDGPQDHDIKGKQNDGAGSKGQVNENNAKKVSGKESKNVGPQNNQSSGWFGGIWGKFSLKPKNQMILPDDKNPTIVWDPEKKKWVNTDGEADEGESFKPPPKMSDLAPQSNHEYSIPHQDAHPPQISQPIAQTTPVPAATPATDGTPVPKGNNLQSNMFKMQRNRTLKNSYVDVFNPSGAPMKPVQPVLAPTLPSVPQTGFFVPPTGSGATVSTEQTDNTPQFYNPNQFGNFQQ
ncbi:protein transport protein Sec16A isoform X4 [Phlebotomus papatasi]|uniref:protein transport protein Sec16A isoform X4 n=1 Tax=Phlebotomus papatasi TaxID=29031 RepID=UPI00248344AE|nr:protein transport protein Sec16A isoform X4 [Phlebotomus papatasi]